jgi:hypothetical protein
MKKGLVSVLFVVVAAATAAGRQHVPPNTYDYAVQNRAGIEGQLQGTVTVRPRMAVETKITKGAPYSAEAITEFVQVLPDGNRITRKTLTRTFRDSEGRTRREQVSSTGHGAESVSISIGDPVAGLTYILDPDTRTAYRQNQIVAMPARVPPDSGAGMGSGGGGGGGRGGRVIPVPAAADRAAAEAALSQTLPAKIAETQLRTGEAPIIENLGQQTIEGILAEGTRTTTIIPAGTIGNAQPIKIVSEQWLSPDLQVLVSTRHSDPRTGESVYRLTNIVRGEQDRSLFEVPADYAVKEPVRRQPGVDFER